MTSPNEQNRPRSLLDCALGSQAKASLERLQEGVERLKTGFPALDRALGGGIPIPTLGVLGAKPKCGKSTLLLQIICNIVLDGGYAYLVDLENGLDRVLKRLMCASADVDPDKIDEGFVPTEPWKKAETLVLEGAYSKRLFIEKERFFDLNLIENRVRELKTLAGDRQCIVVVDSLQKLPMNLSDRRASIDGWMRGLENIRSKYSVVIIVASELKRPQQGQAYKPSEISLKESGDIEYSADLVLTLDRNENGKDEYVTEKAPDPATMRILYNRDGQTGRVANYRLVYPFHRVEEEARPDFEGVRKAGWSGNVTPIRPGVETKFTPQE